MEIEPYEIHKTKRYTTKPLRLDNSKIFFNYLSDVGPVRGDDLIEEEYAE